MAHASHPDTGASQSRRVTISDMSDALGLAKGTVSRALNGYPDISDSTRNRVRRMAEKMGYRPLSHAQAIRTGRVRSLGFVIETSEHDAHRPFLAEFLAGISQSASAEGWTLTVAASTGRKDTMDVMRKLRDDRKADGFILPRTFVRDSRVTLLRDLETPFVMFGRTCDPTGCAWYDIAGEEAMRRAVAHLAALGHRQIGFVNGGTQYNYSQLRLDGFKQGMSEAGLDVLPHLISEDCLSERDGAAAAYRMLTGPTPPTGFVFALDRAALGLYDLARQYGLAIGRDVSLVSYDGVPEGQAASPPLATFSVDIRRAGEKLGALLIRRVRGEAPEDLREIEEATFLDNGSAGSPARDPQELSRMIRAHRKSKGGSN